MTEGQKNFRPGHSEVCEDETDRGVLLKKCGRKVVWMDNLQMVVVVVINLKLFCSYSV